MYVTQWLKGDETRREWLSKCRCFGQNNIPQWGSLFLNSAFFEGRKGSTRDKWPWSQYSKSVIIELERERPVCKSDIIHTIKERSALPQWRLRPQTIQETFHRRHELGEIWNYCNLGFFCMINKGLKLKNETCVLIVYFSNSILLVRIVLSD